MKKFKTLVTALALTAAACAQASPTTYNFSYVASAGGVLSGQLLGTLQADNNSILVSAFLDFVTFNGVPGPSLPITTTLLVLNGGSGPAPTVTLDGSLLDVVACTDSPCSDGFLFDNSGNVGSAPVFVSGISFGSAFEALDASKWSISAAAAVPEPAGLALTGLALAALLVSRRKAPAAAGKPTA